LEDTLKTKEKVELEDDENNIVSKELDTPNAPNILK